MIHAVRFIVMATVCICLTVITGCFNGAHQEAYDMNTYNQALEDTDPQKVDTLQPG